MKTLDRYVVRSFLTSAALWFLIFLSLRVVVDMFVNMDEFTELGLSFSETASRIGSYYSYQSFLYFAQLGGVVIVLSAVTTIAVMNRTNELTAVLASGVSLHRIVWPIILCSMLLGGLVILDEELVIPRIAPKLVRSRDEQPERTRFRVRLLPDASHAVWYSPRCRPGEGVMDSPIIFLRDAEGNALGYVTGQSADWTPQDGRNGWTVSRAVLTRVGAAWRNIPTTQAVYSSVDREQILRKLRDRGHRLAPGSRLSISLPIAIQDAAYGLRIQAEGLDLEVGLSGRDVRMVLVRPTFTFFLRSPSDPGAPAQTAGKFQAASARWVPGEGAEEGCWALERGTFFFPTDLTCEDLRLRSYTGWLDLMSTSQLNRLLQLERVPDRAAAMLVKHIRYTDPVNNLIMLLLGLPFVLSRERQIKASFAICLLMVGTFFVFIYVCRYMDLPPTLAAWLPVLLFGPIAVVLVDSVKT